MTDIQKRYYSIMEVAQMHKVTTEHLRFLEPYTKLKVKRSKYDHRKYTVNQVTILGAYLHLTKTVGFTVKGAAKFLNS